MKIKFLAFIVTVAVIVSCKDFNKSIKDTLRNNDSLSTEYKGNRNSQSSANSLAVGGAAENEMPFTSQKGKLAQAEKQLRALPQFAGKSIFIYKLIHFYEDGRIITKLQNPSNPKYIDEYRYENGKWTAPKPVVMYKNDEIQKNLINLDRLPFVNVCNVFDVLYEKRKEIGSTANDYTIFAATQNGELKWYPNTVKNDRAIYKIEYKDDGSLSSFEQE